MSTRETAHQIRGIVSRAVVRQTDDGAESQTAGLAIHHGVDRQDVEVLQPFGLASRPPAGSLAIVFAVGGDQGDLVALPAGAPQVRLGELQEGEVALYVADGSRVHVKADGTIEIISSQKVVAKVDGAEMELTAEMARGMVGGSRFVARPGYAKLVSGGDHVVVGGGIFVSQDPVVGPDPEPGI